MKKIFVIIFVILSTLILASCLFNRDVEYTLTGPDTMYVGDEGTFLINGKEKESSSWNSSNINILLIDETGKALAISKGEVIISIVIDDICYEKNVVVLNDLINVIETDLKVTRGSFNDLFLYDKSGNIVEDAIFTSNDDTKVLINGSTYLALNTGKVKFTGYSLNDSANKLEVEVEIVEKDLSDYDYHEYQKAAQAILNNMTLAQKVGQMFIVGPGVNTYNDTIANNIRDYHFGNIIYMGSSVTDSTKTYELSQNIQAKMLEENGVYAFISTDQEGGSVNRLTDGATRFLTNMGLAATNNPENAYNVGKAIGEELTYYGINADLAPVVDVNNNPDNPIIGIRSYSDDPYKVALFGNNMVKGFQSTNVMSCAKHFPGHGNTATDSHYGLPKITTSKEDLYKIELAPYINLIYEGIDAIMTTHIIFDAIDKDLPATLSSKVLEGLLRDELKYQGLIITDGMEMQAMTKYFGDFDETAVKAIKAGVDILAYTDMNNPKKAYNGIMNAINKGEITEERINESVLRILEVKLKYGIDQGRYSRLSQNQYNELLASHKDLNQELANNSLTSVLNDYNLSREDKACIVSYESSTINGYTSFGHYASEYLNSIGYNVSYKNVNKKVTESNYNTIVQKMNDYDKIIIVLSDVKKNNYQYGISLVNKLCKEKGEDVLVVAAGNPFDLLSYSNDVKCYVCIYYNQVETYKALTSYLAGEIEANGVSPVKLK